MSLQRQHSSSSWYLTIASAGFGDQPKFHLDSILKFDEVGA